MKLMESEPTIDNELINVTLNTYDIHENVSFKNIF